MQAWRTITPMSCRALNVKLNLTDDMLIRLGLSESISRPDLGLMRNSVVFQGVSSPFAFQVFGGNPDLKPTRGDNLDLSFELVLLEIRFVYLRTVLQAAPRVW